MKSYTSEKVPEAIYSLEEEGQALQEVIQWFKSRWTSNMEMLLEFVQANEDIAIEEKNLPKLISENNRLVDLYEAIFHQFIFCEPYLYRVLAYTTMNPDNLEARQAFFERYLDKLVSLESYYNFLKLENILGGSELAKSMNLQAIPVHTFLIGKVMANLLDEAERRRMEDSNSRAQFNTIKRQRNL
jgi:hypothetical protein